MSAANFESKVMEREQELDAGGRESREEWIRAGKLWATYPTGYGGKKYGDLKPEERQKLAEFHHKLYQLHFEQARFYHQYRNGDPNHPAVIGGL